LAAVKKTFGSKATDFFLSLKPDFKLPKDFEFLLPYQMPETRRITKEFFKKFYDDNNNRIFILGINPGRFGAGTTGVAFTDPINLANHCGIQSNFAPKPELSSTFIYHMIDKAGGAKQFYSRFFLSAICPIGFTRHGKNINYYDDKSLIVSSRKFIEDTLKKQSAFGAFRRVAICLGEGKNLAYLSKLNNELKLFEEIVPLAHPRFIMQYRRKKLEDYISQYLKTFDKVVQKSLT
jgi:hypothetical protein